MLLILFAVFGKRATSSKWGWVYKAVPVTLSPALLRLSEAYHNSFPGGSYAVSYTHETERDPLTISQSDLAASFYDMAIDYP
jgi:hypothetical protein